MNSIFRTYLALILAGLLILSGQSMVMASPTDPAGQIVLCTGSGPVAVYVDENGAPVGPPMYCPDCALHVLDAVQSPQDAPVGLSSRPELLSPGTQVFKALAHPVRVLARGPPIRV